MKKLSLHKIITALSITLFILFGTVGSFVSISEAASLSIEKRGAYKQENKWEWIFLIKTTDLKDGTKINIELYENGKSVYNSPVIIEVKNNSSMYDTGYILENKTDYKIMFTVKDANIIEYYSETVGNPGTSDSVAINPEEPTKFQEEYNLLAPIGDMKQAPKDFGVYLNKIFLIIIGLCAALAVIMIILGGIQYMGDESVFGKTEGKKQIQSAIFGLAIALGAYALLNTINPDLLKSEISIDAARIEGDANYPISPIESTSLPSGIICSGGRTNIPNIVRSFEGKMTYSQEIPKGQTGPNNTIKLDCSGFVNYVLQCAGVKFINGGTTNIFEGAELVKSINGNLINGRELQIGDLVGWKAGDWPKKYEYGHVMIYIGDGMVADSHGPSNPVSPGKALGIFSISKYNDYIKYIRRAQ